MIDRIAHRGPDAAGCTRSTDRDIALYLAHRRLSIIDLSTAADQPFSKGGLTLGYNGELYNYSELRRRARGRGRRVPTSSDTEVVLEAWRRWGPDALRRFRGMFAFAMLRRGTGSITWPATRSASSRCTSCRAATASSSPPS